MPFSELPAYAAFQHRDARTGFEVVFTRHDGWRSVVEGHTSAIEAAEPFAVSYVVWLDAAGRTLSAHVRAQSRSARRELVIEGDGEGRWHVAGVRTPELDGCLDVDLESSSLTNAFPVRRLALEIGQSADAPAVYVRALDGRVNRLEQRYERIADSIDGQQRFTYLAPSFDFRCELTYD